MHMRLHTGHRPYKCDWCDEAFSGAGMLASHKRKHTGEKPYVCSDCGVAFRLLSTLKSHARRHTGEKPFSCELCGSSFAQKAALRRHKKTHLNVKPFKCEHCGLMLRVKENLRRHLLLHKIKFPYVCDTCGAGFNVSKKLENHKMVHNGGDKPYQCNKCPSSFASLKYLTQHKKRVHDRKGSIKCEECSATFTRRETLRSHLRIHMGAGQYVCGHCGAAFNQRTSLTKHIKNHGGKAIVEDVASKETYTCQVCNKIYASSASLKSHMVENHTEEGFVYECSSCHIGFPDQLALVKHKITKHPLHKPALVASVDADDDDNEPVRDKYMCEDCHQTFFRKRQLRAHRKYCLCRDLDDIDDEPEVKPNIDSLVTKKEEVSAVKLVSAALAAASNDSANSTNQEIPPVSESCQSSSTCVVSSSNAQLSSQHYTLTHIGLPHSCTYEQQNLDQVHQNLSCQQQTQETFQHSANSGIMQSLHESLHDSSQNHLQPLDRHSKLQKEIQEDFSQQYSLRVDHHSQHHQPFDFDLCQQEFYKCIPSAHTSSHYRHTQIFDHPDSAPEPQLLQSFSQDLGGCEDLHTAFHHSNSFSQSQKDHVREDIQKQQEQQQMTHSDSNIEDYETDSFHSDIPYQNPLQQQCSSFSPPHCSKIDEKYFCNSDNHYQPFLLHQSGIKARNICPKYVGNYSNSQSKY